MTGTRRWSRVRKLHLGNEPLCRQCGALADQVDHITPIHLGGQPYADANLQSLCQPCHEVKSRAERIAAARSKRDRDAADRG